MQGLQNAKAEIVNEKNVTLTDVLKEMNLVWREFLKKKIPLNDYEALDKQYEHVTVAHKELFQSYPTVLRHMLQQGKYSAIAFEKYLKRITVKPWTNDSERMDSYADYYIFLYKQQNSKYNQTIIQNEWRQYRKILQNEHEEFIKLHETWKKNIDEQEEIFASQRAKDNVDAFKRVAAEKGVQEDQIKKVISLVRSGQITAEMLERLNQSLILGTPLQEPAQPPVISASQTVTEAPSQPTVTILDDDIADELLK